MGPAAFGPCFEFLSACPSVLEFGASVVVIVGQVWVFDSCIRGQVLGRTRHPFSSWDAWSALAVILSRSSRIQTGSIHPLEVARLGCGLLNHGRSSVSLFLHSSRTTILFNVKPVASSTSSLVLHFAWAAYTVRSTRTHRHTLEKSIRFRLLQVMM
jgi:hypothetical protein